MSLWRSRAVLRHQHSQLALRRAAGLRNASTTTSSASEAASAAKDKTAQATSKASEGLSRVTSSAGSAITKLGSATGSALGKIGGRTGRLIGFVQSMVPGTIYYSKVGLELGKLIYQGRQMAPPSAQMFQQYYQRMLPALRDPSNLRTISPANVLNRVRNVSRQELANVGIVTAEIVGFFTVGEMIGRMKLVGYRGGDSHAHH